jgi:hypothetical protein
MSLECLGEALLSQVLVPEFDEAFVFGVKLQVIAVMGIADETTLLLDGYIVVPPIERVQVRPSRETKLETHLRVTHGIAVLLSVMTNGDSR